jgi:hypothetical protein
MALTGQMSCYILGVSICLSIYLSVCLSISFSPVTLDCKTVPFVPC